jgi:hypothetical protein
MNRRGASSAALDPDEPCSNQYMAGTLREQLNAAKNPTQAAHLLSAWRAQAASGDRDCDVNEVFGLLFDLWQENRRHCGLFDVYEQFLSHDPLFEETEGLPAKDRFVRDFVMRSRPLVARRAFSRMPAVKKWTTGYLDRRIGDEIVPVSTRPEHPSLYRSSPEVYECKMLFGDFLRQIVRPSPSNLHITARNGLLAQQPYRLLINDLAIASDIFEYPYQDLCRVSLLIGGAGTTVSMHYDILNVCLGQIMGRKSIYLIPPFLGYKMRNEIGTFASIDLRGDDPDRIMAEHFGSMVAKVTLCPGDLLFIPVSWWHHVIAETTSITLSLRNMRSRANDIQWPTGYWELDKEAAAAPAAAGTIMKAATTARRSGSRRRR